LALQHVRVVLARKLAIGRADLAGGVAHFVAAERRLGLGRPPSMNIASTVSPAPFTSLTQ